MPHHIQIHVLFEPPHYVGLVLMQNEEAEWSNSVTIKLQILAGANSQIGFRSLNRQASTSVCTGTPRLGFLDTLSLPCHDGLVLRSPPAKID